MTKTYRVEKREVITYFDEITADSPEQALEIAKENAENGSFNEDIPELNGRVIRVIDEDGQVIKEEEC